MINIIPQAEAKSKSKFEAAEKVQQQKISDEKTKQRRPKQMMRNGKSRSIRFTRVISVPCFNAAGRGSNFPAIFIYA